MSDAESRLRSGDAMSVQDEMILMRKDIAGCKFPEPCMGCALTRRVLKRLEDYTAALMFYATNDLHSIDYDYEDNGKIARAVLGVE